MRKLFYIGIIALLVVACQSNRQTQQRQASEDSLKDVRVDFVKGNLL